MVYRTFVDSDGITWQVWEVRPATVERRLGERRSGDRHYAGFERRAGGDRRVEREQRVFLGADMAHGWLTFQSDEEKRRYAPIPENWGRLSSVELGELCAAAKPAAQPGRGLRRLA